MKELSRQDKNGVRTATDLERRYKFQEIEPTAEDVTELKKKVVVDDDLSTTSINPVQNKVVTEALSFKVDKEQGKGLSTNDYSTEEKNKLNGIEENADVNKIESISVNNIAQQITNKNVNLSITDNFTQDYQDKVDANTLARHTHTNKAVLDNIISSNLDRWSNIAFYEAGGQTNVNTTLEELVLSSLNTPDTSLWFVQTFFYNSKSVTSNRFQIAYSYSNNKPVMIRNYSNGTFTTWRSCNALNSNISDYSGYIHMGDGTLIQWGRVNITPTGANVVTNAVVYFPIVYDYAPYATAIPHVAYPNIINTSIGGGATIDAAKRSMVIYMTRTNTVSTMFRWFAVGRKEVV